MHIYKSLILSCCLLLCMGVQAQIRTGLHFLPEVSQRSQWNPAAMQDAKFQLQLFGFQPFLGNTGFTINDALVEIPGTDSLEFRLDNLLDKVDQNMDNIIRADMEVDFIGFTIGLKNANMQIGFGIGSKFHSQIGYDSDLIGLLAQGNGAYIDQTVEIGPQLNMMAYTDYGISVAKRFGDKIQVGGRLRYLRGIFTVSSRNHQAALYTSPEYYQLTTELDYEVLGAFPEPDVLDSVVRGGTTPLDITPGLLSGGNNGIALDLSAIVRPIDNLEISAGVNGLGNINWTQNANIYTSQGGFTFEGFEPKDDDDLPLIQRVLNLDFEALGDTIAEATEVNKEEMSFSSGIPTRYFISASYSPIDLIQLGASFQNEQFGELSHNTIGLYGGIKLRKALSLGLSYSNDSNFGYMVGVHSHLNLGGFQLYSSIENIGSIINPRNSQSVAFRVGTNLQFGRWGKSKSRKVETVETDL